MLPHKNISDLPPCPLLTAADGTRDMAAMSNMGAGASPMGQQPDYKKLHAQEKESLELAGSDTKAKWIGDGIEGRVLAMYAK